MSDAELLAKWQAGGRIEDVVDALKDAESKYQGRGSGKAWKWMTRLSSKIMFYGQIIDMFTQHHPEYVALAWGMIKFLLVVSNHLARLQPPGSNVFL